MIFTFLAYVILNFLASFEILDSHQCHHVAVVLLAVPCAVVIGDLVCHDRDDGDDDHVIYFYALYPDLFFYHDFEIDFFVYPPRVKFYYI